MPIFKAGAAVVATPETMPGYKELAAIAIQRTRTAMIITDPDQADNPIVLANNAFLDLTGYTSEEVLGRNCRFLQGPETDPADVAKLRKSINNKSDDVTTEILNYRKDKSVFWNEVLISPITDDTGKVIYYFGSQTDISARRRVEQLEATDRMSALEADLFSGSKTHVEAFRILPSYISALQGRVNALAKANRMLVASGWQPIGLKDIVAAITPVQARPFVQMDGSCCSLPTWSARFLPLVMHELMSNAIAHGALAVTGGRITVSLAKDSKYFIINWQEIGGRIPLTPPEPAYGLQLLRYIVEKHLSGAVSTYWNRDGFNVQMALPVNRRF